MFISKGYKDNDYLFFINKETGRRTKLSISTVEKILNDYLTAKPEIISRAYTLENLQTDVLKYVEDNHRKTTVLLYFRCFNYLIACLGNMPVNTITIHNLEKFKEKRLAEVTKSTVNIDIRTMKAIFNIACKWKHIENSPAKDIKLLKVDQKEILAFKDGEIELILSKIPNQNIRNIVDFNLLTGCRINEILNVQIKDICFDDQLIKIRNKDDFKTKNGKNRNIPISNKLNDLLRKILFPSGNILSLPNPDSYLFIKNGIKFNKDYVSKSFKKALRAGGFDERFHFHCLRHTFITNLIRSGVNINHVKEIAGHSDIQTTMNYIHLVTEDLREAVNRI